MLLAGGVPTDQLLLLKGLCLTVLSTASLVQKEKLQLRTCGPSLACA